MARRRKAPALLTNLELEVMQVVWEAAESVSVREVVELLNLRREEPLAYNTVQTMLSILREKGVVHARPGGGRAHVFHSRLSRDEVTTHMVGDLVDRLFGGEARPLLLHLMQREELSQTELRELRRVVEEQLSDEEGEP